MISRLSIYAAAAALPLFASAHAGDLMPDGGGYKDFGPMEIWNGFYVGVNAGYGGNTGNSKLTMSGTASYTGTTATPEGLCNVTTGTCVKPTTLYAEQAVQDPVFGGGQIGYNVQHGRFVYGLEADFDGAGSPTPDGYLHYNVTPGGITIPTPPISTFPGDNYTVSSTSELEWIGTLRGRLGYTVGERSLLYVTGGFAFAGAHATVHSTLREVPTGCTTPAPACSLTLPVATATTFPTATQSFDDTITGFALGAGFEHAFSPAWSIKMEYQYIDMGSDTLTAISSNPASPATDNTTGKLANDYEYQTVRIGLNYHLNTGWEPMPMK